MQDARTHNIDDAFWVAAGTGVLGINGEFAHVSEGLVSRRRDGSEATRIWEIQGSLLSCHINVDHAIWGGKSQERGGTMRIQARINSHTRTRTVTCTHTHARAAIPVLGFQHYRATGGETEAWRHSKKLVRVWGSRAVSPRSRACPFLPLFLQPSVTLVPNKNTQE